MLGDMLQDMTIPSFKGVRAPCRNLAHDRLPSHPRRDVFDRRRVFALQMNNTYVTSRLLTAMYFIIKPSHPPDIFRLSTLVFLRIDSCNNYNAGTENYFQLRKKFSVPRDRGLFLSCCFPAGRKITCVACIKSVNKYLN
jgi:hypothetical protein